MKKRLFALLLALCLCIPASAAQNSAENFVRQRNYTGQFFRFECLVPLL